MAETNSPLRTKHRQLQIPEMDGQQMTYKVDDIAWTVNQRLEGLPFTAAQYGGLELLSPRRVKIIGTPRILGQEWSLNPGLWPNLQHRKLETYYTTLLCDENGDTHPGDVCLCKEYELYKTEQEATIVYKKAVEREISRLKNLLSDHTNTLTLLNHNLDSQPLTFGKHRGKTPQQLLEKHASYIAWMYENVTSPTCSLQLYKEAKRQLDEEAMVEEMRYHYDAEDYGDR